MAMAMAIASRESITAGRDGRRDRVCSLGRAEVPAVKLNIFEKEVFYFLFYIFGKSLVQPSIFSTLKES